MNDSISSSIALDQLVENLIIEALEDKWPVDKIVNSLRALGVGAKEEFNNEIIRQIRIQQENPN